jgi:hypothetical protein
LTFVESICLIALEHKVEVYEEDALTGVVKLATKLWRRGGTTGLEHVNRVLIGKHLTTLSLANFGRQWRA